MADNIDASYRVIKVRFPQNILSVKELSTFVRTLEELESFSEASSDYQFRARAKLVSFHVGSPPEVAWYANPAFIATIIITALGNYHNYKNNLPAMERDLRRTIAGIRGLSRESKSRLFAFVFGMVSAASGHLADRLEYIAGQFREMESFFRHRSEGKQQDQTIGHEGDEMRSREPVRPIIEVLGPEDDTGWLD